jgi:hypothetical protein
MHHHVTRIPTTPMIEAVDHESFFEKIFKRPVDTLVEYE